MTKLYRVKRIDGKEYLLAFFENQQEVIDEDNLRNKLMAIEMKGNPVLMIVGEEVFQKTKDQDFIILGELNDNELDQILIDMESQRWKPIDTVIKIIEKRITELEETESTSEVIETLKGFLAKFYLLKEKGIEDTSTIDFEKLKKALGI